MRFWSGSRRWTERIFYVAPVRITRAATESRGRLAMKHRSSDPAVGEAEGLAASAEVLQPHAKDVDIEADAASSSELVSTTWSR